jgi:hypothetical protein
MLKLVKFQSLAAKFVKCRKYSPAKFAHFVLICITPGKVHHIWSESGRTDNYCLAWLSSIKLTTIIG